MNGTITELNHLAGHASRRCHDCGALMRGQRGSYHYQECGLESVKLQNVLVFQCDNCGVRVPEIPKIDELHTLIAVDLLQKQTLLSGQEVRFLRKMAGLSQKELAKIMGVDPTRPSKWENESGPGGIGKENDRLLRAYFLVGMVRQRISGDDGGQTVAALTAIKFLQAIDVRRIFEELEGKNAGSKSVSVRENPAGNSWFIPELQGAAAHVR